MHLGTRHVVRFDMVGVKLDEAWDDEVAGHVLGARRRPAAAEFRNDAIGGHDPPAFDHLIGEHQTGICKKELVIRHGYQAAAKLATSTIWSATASRMSLSWMIATTATPSRFFFAMRSTTTARFSLSSEAVGSSSSNTGRSGRNPLAMFTRCCSPPEKVAGGTAISRSGMLSRRSRTAALTRPWSAAAWASACATTSMAATRGTARRNWLT